MGHNSDGIVNDIRGGKVGACGGPEDTGTDSTVGMGMGTGSECSGWKGRGALDGAAICSVPRNLVRCGKPTLKEACTLLVVGVTVCNLTVLLCLLCWFACTSLPHSRRINVGASSS